MANDALQDRLQQLSFALESDPGTEVADGTLLADANTQHLLTAIAVDPDIQRQSRNVKRNTFTPVVDTPTLQQGTASWAHEFAMHTTIGTKAPWMDFLEIAGLRRIVYSTVAIGAITNGPIPHGAILRVDTAGDSDTNKRVRCILDTYDGATHVYFEPLGSGAPTISLGEKLLSADGSVSYGAATAASTASEGQAYVPVSFSAKTSTLSSITGGDYAVGDIIQLASDDGSRGIVVEGTDDTNGRDILVFRTVVGAFSASDAITNGTVTATMGAISHLYFPSSSLAMLSDGVREKLKGARSSIQFAAAAGGPLILTHEAQGSFVSVNDGGNIDVSQYPLQVPPNFLTNAQVAVGDNSDATPTVGEEANPVIKSIGLNMNNTLGFRTDANDVTGILEARLENRAPQLEIVLEHSLEAFFPWVGKVIDGSTFRFTARIGATVGNRCLIQVPYAQPVSVTKGEDGGVTTRTIQANCTSGASSISAGSNADNDFVIVFEDALT